MQASEGGATGAVEGVAGGMTPEAAVAKVVQSEPLFAVEEVEVRGVTFRAFKNIPPTVPALMKAGWARHGDGQLEYLVYEADRYSYADFCGEVNRLAQALQARGIGRGDRVALAMRNYPELLILVLAISSTGATVVFLNAWWTTTELSYAHVSYKHLRAHETVLEIVCRLLLEKKKKQQDEEKHT